MSSTTLVVLVTKTLTEPLDVPAGMMAALALMRPSSEFRVETVGWPSPVGQMVRYDRRRYRNDGDVERIGDSIGRNAAGIVAFRQRERARGVGRNRRTAEGAVGIARIDDAARRQRHELQRLQAWGFTICMTVPLLGRVVAVAGVGGDDCIGAYCAAMTSRTARCRNVSVTAVQPEMAEPFEVKPTVPWSGGPAGVTLAVIVTCSSTGRRIGRAGNRRVGEIPVHHLHHRVRGAGRQR